MEEMLRNKRMGNSDRCQAFIMFFIAARSYRIGENSLKGKQLCYMPLNLSPTQRFNLMFFMLSRGT